MRTVLHYSTGSYLPLTQNWIFNLISNFEEYSSVFYAFKRENCGVFSSKNIKVRNLSSSGFFSLLGRACNKVFHLNPYIAFSLARDNPVVAHAHFGPSGCAFLGIKRFFGLPLVTSFYGSDFRLGLEKNSEWNLKYKSLFEEGNLFVVEGNHAKSSLIKLGCPAEKVVVNHLGVDVDRIAFVPRKIRRSGEIRLLTCGRFVEKKGIPYAIEAFARVKKKHPGINLKFNIIGDSENGEKAKILETIRRNKLDASIRLLGNCPYPFFLKELYNSHIFIHPSVHALDGDCEGGSPVAIAEASASGMPVLSTNHCDIPEVVLDRKSGFLVGERDVEELAEKLEKLIMEPEKWWHMGSRGRNHIVEEYNVKNQARNLEKIYDSLL